LFFKNWYMLKFSSSSKIPFFNKFLFTILICFFIGLLFLSIFWRTA
jgi:hypothetical protein